MLTAERWRILAVLFLVRSAMGFQFQSVAATAPLLVDAFKVDYTAIGALIGLFMLPGAVISLPGGMLARHFSDRRLCATALLLMSVGGLGFAAADDWAAVMAARIASGAGSVLMSLVITKMVTDWFAGREIVTAMGVMLAAWPCGIALALVSQPPLATASGWRAVGVATTVVCLVAFALVVAFYRPPPGAAPHAAAIEPRRGLGRREVLAMAVAGIVWGLFNVGYIVFFSFTPTLLVERGLTLVAAGNLASLGLWLGMPALPLGGLLAERSGHPRAAMVVFSLACGAFLLLLSGSPAPLLFCILFGVAIGPPAGVIMALPAEVLPPERRAMGFAVFYTVYYVGMAVGPALAGFARDRWQSAAAALVAGALMFWAIPPMLLLFRAVARPLRR